MTLLACRFVATTYFLWDVLGDLAHQSKKLDSSFTISYSLSDDQFMQHCFVIDPTLLPNEDEELVDYGSEAMADVNCCSGNTGGRMEKVKVHHVSNNTSRIRKEITF